MDLSVYDREYDTDDVSVTSTAPSEGGNEKTYDVEAILSEGIFQLPDKNNTEETRYLIKWLNYDAHE